MRNLFSRHQPPFSLAVGQLALLFALPFITPPAVLVAQNPVNPALVQLFHGFAQYRCDTTKWNRNIVNGSWQYYWNATQPRTIGLTTYEEEHRTDLFGDCQPWVDPKLMESANATAQKFANGTYNYSLPNPHNQIDGDKLRGPTMRAFKDNWEPRILFKRQIPMPFVIHELLFQGPPNLDPNQVLEAWKNTSSGNLTMLALRTGAVGLGMAQNGTHSYWVLLIETQFPLPQFPEPFPSDFYKLISEGQLYRMLPGINADRRYEIEEDSSLRSDDLWEFIPGAIANLRSRM
ncbi:MAG: hypothetical protein ACKVT2_09860 [Saprospiraceae bacterium]